MTTPQLTTLATQWPQTYAALRLTYYPHDSWCQTTPDGRNDCGYTLQGLSRYRLAATDLHGHRGLSDTALDHAAAREVYYQHGRAAQFRRPCAALSACWAALVTERPEKLFAARGREARNGTR